MKILEEVVCRNRRRPKTHMPKSAANVAPTQIHPHTEYSISGLSRHLLGVSRSRSGAPVLFFEANQFTT